MEGKAKSHLPFRKDESREIVVHFSSISKLQNPGSCILHLGHQFQRGVREHYGRDTGLVVLPER
jgi:hypothetical protein